MKHLFAILTLIGAVMLAERHLGIGAIDRARRGIDEVLEPRRVARDVAWALINTAEFQYRH